MNQTEIPTNLASKKQIKTLYKKNISSIDDAVEFLSGYFEILTYLTSRPPYYSENEPDIIDFYPEHERTDYTPADLKQQNKYLNTIIGLREKAESIADQYSEISLTPEQMTLLSDAVEYIFEKHIEFNESLLQVKRFSSEGLSRKDQVIKENTSSVHQISAITGIEIFHFLRSLGYAEEKEVNAVKYFHIKSHNTTNAEYLLSFTIESFYCYRDQNPQLEVQADTKQDIAKKFFYIRKDSEFIPESIGEKALRHTRNKVERLDENVQMKIKQAVQSSFRE